MPYNVVLHANGSTYGTFGPYRSKKDAQADARALRTRLNPKAKASVVQVRKEAIKVIHAHEERGGHYHPYLLIAMEPWSGREWFMLDGANTLAQVKDRMKDRSTAGPIRTPYTGAVLLFKRGKKAGDWMEVGFFAPGSSTYRKHKIPKRPNGRMKKFLQSLGRGAAKAGKATGRAAKRGAKLTYEYGKEAAQAGGERIAESGRQTAEAAQVGLARAKVADMERAAQILGLADVGVKLKDLPNYRQQTREAEKLLGDVRVARGKRGRALTEKRQKRAGSRQKRLAANSKYRGVRLIVDKESGMTQLTDPISGKRVGFSRTNGGVNAARSFIDRRLGR